MSHTCWRLTTRYAAEYRIAAVADHNGKKAFNVHHRLLQGSSLYQERDGAGYDGSRRDVECVTLDTLIDYGRSGICVYDMFDRYNRPLDGALASVDVMFVKKNRPFRSVHNRASAEQGRMLG